MSTLRAALNSCGGDDGEIALGIDKKVNVDKLVGEKRAVSVGKDGFQLVRSSGQINLIVNGLKFPAGNFRGVVAVVRIDDELHAGTELAVHVRKLILWQAENHRYRLELGDD